MIRDNKYKSWQYRIICPVCNNYLTPREWEDYGMHLHCTEYFLSGRYLNDLRKRQKENSYLIKSMVNEI